MGLASYRGTLRAAGDADGLWLDVLGLFRPGHAPLFIPWDDLTEEAGVLRARQAPRVALRLPPDVRALRPG